MTRVKFLKFCLLFAVGIIAVRLFFVQIIQHDEWVAKADAQHTLENTIVAKRGEIYMLDEGEPSVVVMNETVYTIAIDPLVTNQKKATEVLEQYAKDNLSVKLEEVFEEKQKRYVVVAKNVSLENAKKIQEADIYGIMFQKNTKRVYPEGNLASGLLGFVNLDGKGQYGVEGALNSELAGKNGLLRTVKDVNNVALSIGDNNVKVPAENGKNIVLTIDKNIQYETEQILLRAIARSKAENASALVMDPSNGKILAVANVPNYDAGEYWNVKDMTSYVNHAFEDAIEPASVCKTFTFATGIDLGVLTPQTTYQNDGYTVVDGWKIQNADQRKKGVITMQDALDYSLNTGSIQALRLIGGSETKITQLGRERLYDYYYNKFGLGQKTGVELFEAAGIVADPNKGDGRDSMYANMTFGQNIQLTMLQVAAGFSALVNGGKYYSPTVVAGEMVDGEFVEAKEKAPIRQAISETTSATMREMVLAARGIWKNANDKKGYDIGGKTGTAQVIRDGKYVLDETQATYIGYGAEKGGMPEYVVMVRIWSDGKYMAGGTDALPIFTEISNYLLDYLKLKPAE